MFRFHKIKKSYRFIITLYQSQDEIKISKLSSILNQAGLDESLNIDEYLEFFFNDFLSRCVSRKIRRFTAVVTFVRWKNPNLFNHLEIKPFVLTEFFLKYKGRRLLKYCYSRFMLSDRFFNIKNYLFSKAYFFLYGLLESFRWNLIHGFFFNFDNINSYIQSYRGTKFAYRKRRFMLGRKINFRMKVKGKKFEEYN